MAVTVDQVAREVIASVASNAGLLHAIRWCSQRYRQLSNRGKLRALRVVDQLVIPGEITTGTVTTVQGSDAIVGDATASAAWAATVGDLVGRYVRVSRNWYRIMNVETTGLFQQLRLRTAYTEDAGVGSSYTIVQRHTRMPVDFRYAGSYTLQRMWRPLHPMSLTELDLAQPERIYVSGSGPETVTDVGDDEDGRRLFEFYPYPLNAEQILFSYYRKSPDLVPGSILPVEIDIEALKSGVLIDIYRWEMAKALRDNRPEVGATWRNELRAQETSWEEKMDELFRVSTIAEDTGIILYATGNPPQDDNFIRSARQDAISRLGNFP